MLVVRACVLTRYKSLVGLRELPVASGENCVLMLRKLCPLRPGVYHVGVTKVRLFLLFVLQIHSFSNRSFHIYMSFLPFFPTKCPAVSEGGHLPAAGVQTGAHKAAGCADPAALRTHVFRSETLFGLSKEGHRFAGTVPRLPHQVSQAAFSQLGLATKWFSLRNGDFRL